jgi:hypothetical protein
MKLLWGFYTVPTIYAIYIVVDKENGVLKFVKEFKTKGHAVNWIAKSGEKEITYCVQTHIRRS